MQKTPVFSREWLSKLTLNLAEWNLHEATPHVRCDEAKEYDGHCYGEVLKFWALTAVSHFAKIPGYVSEDNHQI